MKTGCEGPAAARADPTILSAMSTVTVDEVQEALTNVIDPELGLDFVELGLIYEVEVEGGEVFITFTLTSPGCPIGPQVAEQMEEFVGRARRRERRAPEDGLHARLDAGPDERGREVRPRLLTRLGPCAPRFACPSRLLRTPSLTIPLSTRRSRAR